MSFTIPNLADAAFADQAEVDKVDVDILVAAHNGNRVISGCAVTAQGSPDMTVAVASGSVLVNGATVSVSSGNVTVTAANGTNPRFDLIVVDDTGTKSCTAGTAAANPVFPTIPADSVVLAAVYVPANDTDIDANQIVDKRVLGAAGGASLTNDGYAADDGSLLHGPAFPLVFPPSAGWSWVNQVGGDTIDTASGAHRLTLVSRGANSFTLRTRTAPATPYTITAGFRMVQWSPGTIWLGGVGWRQSSDGKFILIGFSNGGAMGSSDWDSVSSFNGNNTFFTPSLFFRGSEFWVQFVDDGTNRKTRWGISPLSFAEFQSEGRTVHLTADEVFFGAQGDGGEDTLFDLFHWSVT